MNRFESFTPLFLKLPPDQIAYLTDIIESYEGLGVVRTLDPFSGEVVILALSDTIEVVRELVTTLQPELCVKIIDAPQSVSGDWLLSEMACS